MKATLTIQGMHCNACKELIRMEIDDLELSDTLGSISVIDGANLGSVELHNISLDQVNSIVAAINNMEQYSVTDKEIS